VRRVKQGTTSTHPILRAMNYVRGLRRPKFSSFYNSTRAKPKSPFDPTPRPLLRFIAVSTSVLHVQRSCQTRHGTDTIHDGLRLLLPKLGLARSLAGLPLRIAFRMQSLTNDLYDPTTGAQKSRCQAGGSQLLNSFYWEKPSICRFFNFWDWC